MKHVLRYNLLLGINGKNTVLFPFSFVQSVRWLLGEKLFVLRLDAWRAEQRLYQVVVCLMNGEEKTGNANKLRNFILLIL
jgi:hypothetical protein